MKFSRQWITLVNGDAEPWVSVKAQVFEAFAIHPYVTQYGHGGFYTLTHIPTGMKLADAYKLRDLKTLISDLHALGLDWNFTTRFMPKSHTEKAIPLIRAFNSNPSY